MHVTRQGFTRSAPFWCLAGLLGALVIGIIAMHGLTSHSRTPSHHAVLATTAASPTEVAVHGGEPGAPVDTPHRAAVAAAQVHNEGDDESSGFQTLCLAVLVVAGIWLARRAAAIVRVGWLAPRLSAVALVRPVTCGRPPPSLAHLSILRC